MFTTVTRTCFPYVYTSLLVFNYVNTWLPMFTPVCCVNLCLLVHVYLCLPMFTRFYLRLLYTCLPMFTPVYSCYPCLLVFNYVLHFLIVHVYLYLPLFTRVYLCFTLVYLYLLLFNSVYLCSLVFSYVLHF